jgi:hypothetical protein
MPSPSCCLRIAAWHHDTFLHSQPKWIGDRALFSGLVLRGAPLQTSNWVNLA